MALIIGSAISGLLLLTILKRHKESFKSKVQYLFLRAAIFGFLLTPTIFGIGHGVIPTNGLSGLILVISGPGENYKYSLSLFALGRNGGGTVILIPCVVVFMVNYVLNLVNHKYA